MRLCLSGIFASLHLRLRVHLLMNIAELHAADKAISALAFFKEGTGQVLALHLATGAHLKEHVTSIPAMLVCVSGRVQYADENGHTAVLSSGDYQPITAHVKHHVDGLEDAQLLLLK